MCYNLLNMVDLNFEQKRKKSLQKVQHLMIGAYLSNYITELLIMIEYELWIIVHHWFMHDNLLVWEYDWWAFLEDD